MVLRTHQLCFLFLFLWLLSVKDAKQWQLNWKCWQHEDILKTFGMLYQITVKVSLKRSGWFKEICTNISTTIKQCQRTFDQDISTRAFNKNFEVSVHRCPPHRVTTNFTDYFLNLGRLPRDLYAHLHKLNLSSWFFSCVCQTELLKYHREFWACLILSFLMLLALLYLFLPSE